MGYPMEFQERVHLLSSHDLTPRHPAAELVRSDGSRQALSQALLTALDHVVAIAGSDQSVLLSPIEECVGFATAAGLTAMSEQQFRDLAAEGTLVVRPDVLGGTIALRDVVALDAQFRQWRQTWLADQFADDVAFLEEARAARLDNPDDVDHV